MLHANACVSTVLAVAFYTFDEQVLGLNLFHFIKEMSLNFLWNKLIWLNYWVLMALTFFLLIKPL